MKILFRHLILSLSTAYYFSRNKGLLKFFEIFYIRFFFAFDYIRNRFNKSKKFSFESEDDFFFFKNEKKNLLKELEEFGYTESLEIDDKFLAKVQDEISLKNSSISFKQKANDKNFQQILTPEDQLDDIFQKSRIKNLSHVVINIDINSTNYIKQIVQKSFLKNLAYSYIGSKNIYSSAICYISHPKEINEQEKKDNAQYYHYDLDFEKFFKVFIYFDDVSKESGPHSFVKKTHKKKLFKHIISERLDDKEIKNTYGKENIIIFDRKKGSVIIEDTSGLHKGTTPTGKSRKVLILVFGKNLGIEVFKYPLKILLF